MALKCVATVIMGENLHPINSALSSSKTELILTGVPVWCQAAGAVAGDAFRMLK